MKTIFRFFIAGALLVAAACSKNTKDTASIPGGGKVTMEKKGDQVSYEVKTKSGEKVTLNVSEGNMKPVTPLPADLPAYPKAVLKMDNAVGTSRMLGFYTRDPVADGVKFYTDELQKQGWKIDASMAMGEGHMLTAEKDKRACQVMITPDAKQTYIQLTVSTTE